MGNNQFNQVPISQISPETLESVSKINKLRWTVFFSIWVLLFELGLLYFYAYCFSDKVSGGLLPPALGAFAVSLCLGTPIGIVGSCLSFFNYRQGKKIFAIIFFILSISVIAPPFFSMNLGKFLAPILFPSLSTHVQ